MTPSVEPASLLLAGDARGLDLRWHAGVVLDGLIAVLSTPLETILVVPAAQFAIVRAASKSARTFEEFVGEHRGVRGTEAWLLAGRAIARLLEERDTRCVRVPPTFPFAVAKGLREEGIELIPTDAPERRPKRFDEVEAVRAASVAACASYALALDALASARIRDDGLLELTGEVLTAERLRQLIEGELSRRECETPERCICAPGAQAADQHALGSGPLRAHEAIVIDIYPRHRSGYFADIAGTVARGEPNQTVAAMYDAVRGAQRAGIAALRAGACAADVHHAAEAHLQASGYGSLGAPRPGRPGLTHWIGHGVGLELHEAPTLAPLPYGASTLVEGDVVAIEPGLYLRGIAGVRLESLCIVTADGAIELSDVPHMFVL